MTEDAQAAKAKRDRAKRRLNSAIEVARQRLQPRALAVDAADAVASRASRVLTRAKPTARWQQMLALTATLAGIGASVVLRLHLSRQKNGQMQPDATSAVPLPIPPELERLP
jgi:hypothetical protein